MKGERPGKDRRKTVLSGPSFCRYGNLRYVKQSRPAPEVSGSSVSKAVLYLCFPETGGKLYLCGDTVRQMAFFAGTVQAVPKKIFNQDGDWSGGPWMTKAGIPFLIFPPCFKTAGAPFLNHMVPGVFPRGGDHVPDGPVLTEAAERFHLEPGHINARTDAAAGQIGSQGILAGWVMQTVKYRKNIGMNGSMAGAVSFGIHIQSQIPVQKSVLEGFCQPVKFCFFLF